MKGVYEQDKETFERRINKLAREEAEMEGEPAEKFDSESGRWFFGVNNRNRGSVHSDIWQGTVAELADCNLIAVHPVSGWWKQRKNLKKQETKTRYSLIIGLEMEEEVGGRDVDLYTEIQNEIKVQLPVEVTV